ncbi:MAG: hypothetical protein L6243_05700 [Candidatus Altiarchaeales archaeon]|nr:hypothetical protein [Candidatus Altiarchaeota archaeon]MBU4342173.1 hypothetical protein [Candidatus Altiarchaeota archaeon]MBU4437680.1 hypothetical protein [Candidatus Altiarchaeota archaeon]MCG2783065.1 hypothetical protein [Candidatus Altiarchaeales archaeon]
MMDSDEIKSRVLHKLARQRRWGGKHTSFENLQKGFPSHLAKDVKVVGKGLVKEGLLLSKPTGYGLEICLNPRMKKEIIAIIEKYFKKDY